MGILQASQCAERAKLFSPRNAPWCTRALCSQQQLRSNQAALFKHKLIHIRKCNLSTETRLSAIIYDDANHKWAEMGECAECGMACKQSSENCLLVKLLLTNLVASWSLADVSAYFIGEVLCRKLCHILSQLRRCTCEMHNLCASKIPTIWTLCCCCSAPPKLCYPVKYVFVIYANNIRQVCTRAQPTGCGHECGKEHAFGACKSQHIIVAEIVLSQISYECGNSRASICIKDRIGS